MAHGGGLLWQFTSFLDEWVRHLRLLFFAAFTSHFTWTDAVFVLKALGEIGGRTEACVVGYFGYRLV